MLEILNRYAHGFVVVPVVLACRRGGVFEAMKERPRTAEELGKQLGANVGHLQVALRLIESLGWIDRGADGRFKANASLAKQRLVPDNLLELLNADMDAYLREGRGGFLAPWIDKVRARWSVDDELVANFFDGLLVVPLLVLLAKSGVLKDLHDRDFADLPPGIREEVVSLFKILGWLEGSVGQFRLTDPGKFMFQRAMNLGVTESYKPMLVAMDTLLFGDARSVFTRIAVEHEPHVDRSTNVISSGFQHDCYFAEVEQILISIFNREPLSAQPRYVADMGCGDGTLLKRVYETVRDKTSRGKRLAEYPLTLIRIDPNQASLAETERTLYGIAHVLIAGDIGNPRKVMEDLQDLGIDSTDVLHVRSFRDHDRPYIPPQDQASLAARAGARYLGAYVDGRGNAVPPAAVVQSLVEHFQRWAEVVAEHGLILLEVHCLDPAVVRVYLDQSESLHFDALQGFSQQLLVEADVALMAAAEAGLFPRRENFRKYPAVLPFCRIALNQFERRPYRVRIARHEDLPALLRLEDACWPKGMRTAQGELQRRIDTYALGQWVLEMDGEVVGVIYSQRISDVEQLRSCESRHLAGLSDENGPVVQLIALNVLPEKQHLGLGYQLLDLILLRSALQGGVRQVAAVTRCKNFRGRTLEEFVEYYEQRDVSGAPADPIVRFHYSHGARILGVVAGFRPEDTDNLGTGVLVSYDLEALPAQAKFPLAGTEVKVAPDAGSQLEIFLRSVLGPSRQAAFSWNRPFREMGLDSLNLMELRTLLEQGFGVAFGTTFFFAHPTLQDIRLYLSESRLGAYTPNSLAPQRLNHATGSRATVESSSQHVPKKLGVGDSDPDPIALIGMAAKFPGCADLEAFWELLAHGLDAIAEIPAERWNVDEFYSADPDAPGKIVSRYGGFLRNVDEFDAAFFNISPREAELMDPQQRLLLEMHWEALENAGINANRLREKACGIFVGLSSHDYEILQIVAEADNAPGAHNATGNSGAIASGRLAYFLGTRGPAITIDTACSSSLVAVHQAVRSLRSGECDLAMASGANLILLPRISIAYSNAGMLSPRGQCSTFDEAADGYVRSEGCGVVVLKRLSDAERDGDAIFAVIRGSAVNQDGASNGLTAPSLPAQEALLRSALTDARLRPADIDYIEAHGTGTQLGDPVEFQALRNVFHEDAERSQPLLLGSVKTNIGHAEAAAGIAGLIKTVMSLQHQLLPAHLHFQKANSQIDLSSVPARIPIQSEPWHRKGRPLRAGVSSFGFSGTNSHVIVEQAPALAVPELSSDRPAHLLTLSAKSAPALQALVTRYAEWLPNYADIGLADICATAHAGRATHDFRIAFSGSTHDGLARSLREGAQRAAATTRLKSEPNIAFLFTGQGSQYAGMARELFLTEPAFRSALSECAEILAGELSEPLEKLLWPDSGATSLLDQTANTQPALFAVEYALARMLQSWGVEPNAVMGHSVGEYVAACIAGVFSLSDGLKLIAARGRLMQALPRDGAMLAILGPVDLVREAVKASSDAVSIAAFNGPTNTVISGRRDAIDAVARRVEEQGARVVPLQVSHAFHSDLMEPILPTFKEVARWVRFSKPNISFASNVTGEFASDEVTGAEYWVRHVRQPVEFAKSIRALWRASIDVMLEIGPQPVLSTMGKTCLDASESDSVQWLHTLARGASDWYGVLASIGVLYEKGVDIDWQRFDAGRKRRRVSLPTYPWQRKRHWFTSGIQPPKKNSPAPSEAPADWFYETQWIPRSRLTEERPRPVADFLPAIPALAENLRARAAVLAEQHGVDQSGRAFEAIEKLALQYAIAALRQLGIADFTMEPIAQADLADRLRIAPRHRRLFGRIIAMLVEDGIVQKSDAGLRVNRDRIVADALERAADSARQVRSSEIELALLNRCGANLAAILRGEEEPLHLLFPVDSTHSAEHLYRDAPGARVYNTLVADAIAAAVEQLPRGRILRILEVGAGTGGTASFLLNLLPAQRTEYVFTDVSKSLLQKSAERFRSFPFVRYESLDIESDPRAQGFAAEQFDIVIAANVIHATRDLRRTLAHIRQLLAPRGMFLLLETTGARRWVDLTFGLTTGWWSFTDTETRTQHPLLGREKWLELLATEGFVDVGAVGNENSSTIVFEQHLIAARAPLKAAIAPGSLEEPVELKQSGQWLIVAERSGVGSALDRQLQARGYQTTVVDASDIFGTIGQPREHKIDSFFDLARSKPKLPLRGVIHMSSLDAPENGFLGTETLKGAQRVGCESALRMLRSLVEREWSEPPKIWLVTRGAQWIDDSMGAPNVAQAPLWGVGKVMAQEYPDMWGGLVDLPAAGDDDEAARMLGREIFDVSKEDEIAFREGNRLVPRLIPLAPPTESRPSFSADVSYLITGGLGKIGLIVARWLVDHGARSLVLVGRTGLPDRSAWPDLVSGSGDYDKVRAVEHLELEGAHIHVHAANVSDSEAMRLLFSRFGRDLPPLKGVIHTAAVMEGVPIRKIDAAAIERVFSSKVDGAWILHELTRGLELDFFALFSSVGSSWGFRGISAYAAANAFLDVLARFRRTEGLPAIAINWGLWKGGGSSATVDRFYEENGLKAMRAALALDAFGRLLGTNRAQAAVASVDWPILLPIYETKRGRPFFTAFRANVAKSRESENSYSETVGAFLSELHATPEKAAILLENHVRDALARVLHIDSREPIDRTRGFFNLGLDSLMTGELRGLLQQSLGRKLPATIAFEYPTISDLTNYLLRTLGLAESTRNLPVTDNVASGAAVPSPNSLDELEDHELASILDEELERILNKTARRGQVD